MASIPLRLRDLVLPALAQLWAAYQLANCVPEAASGHGIAVRQVLSHGGALSGVKWLLDHGFAAPVTTRTGLPLTPRTRIALTARGAGLAKSLFLKATNGRRTKPHWKPQTSELWFGRELIKRYAQPSDNQCLILTSFERCQWQSSIVDPLISPSRKRRRRHLYDTIRRLNAQRPQRVRFFLTGNGTRVGWELLH